MGFPVMTSPASSNITGDSTLRMLSIRDCNRGKPPIFGRGVSRTHVASRGWNVACISLVWSIVIHRSCAKAVPARNGREEEEEDRQHP